MKNLFMKTISRRNDNTNLLPQYIINQMINDSDETTFMREDMGTRVVFIVNQNNEVYGFMMYGQTGYAMKPFDIVSSCLVTMSHFVVTTIENFTEDKYDFKQSEPDKLHVFVLPSLKHGRANEISKVVLRNMVTETLEIERQYSDYVNVYIKYDY